MYIIFFSCFRSSLTSYDANVEAVACMFSLFIVSFVSFPFATIAADSPKMPYPYPRILLCVAEYALISETNNELPHKFNLSKMSYRHVQFRFAC